MSKEGAFMMIRKTNLLRMNPNLRQPSLLHSAVNASCTQYQTDARCCSFHSTTKVQKSWDLGHFSARDYHGKQPINTRVSKRSPAWLGKLHATLMKYVRLQKDEGAYTNNSLPSTDNNKLFESGTFYKCSNKAAKKTVSDVWQKFDSMTMEQILNVADILYMNGREIQLSSYTRAMTLYMNEYIVSLQLNPLQLVRLAFHIQQPSSPASQLLFELEKKLEQDLSHFTIDEVAYICHLWFSRQYRFQSMTLVDKIASKLLEEFDCLKANNLPMLMKAFRYSNYIKVSFYKQLGDFIVSKSYLENLFDAGHLMHLGFAFASVHITHHELFKSLLQRLLQLKHTPRLKDLSKIVWACGFLMTSEPEHLKMIHTIVDQVRDSVTREQALKYPDNVVDFFVGLACLNIYPLDLYDRLLGRDAMKILLGFDARRAKFLQLQFLHTSLSIECPGSNMKLLSESELHVVEQNLQHFNLAVDKKLRKPLIPVVEALTELFGKECVHCCFVLPHFKTADILLTFDRNKNKFVNNERATNDDEPSEITRVIVMLLSKAQTSYDNKPLGMLQCKMRQLDTLGYKIVQINAEESLSYILMEKHMIQQTIMSHIYQVIGNME